MAIPTLVVTAARVAAPVIMSGAGTVGRAIVLGATGGAALTGIIAGAALGIRGVIAVAAIPGAIAERRRLRREHELADQIDADETHSVLFDCLVGSRKEVTDLKAACAAKDIEIQRLRCELLEIETPNLVQTPV